MTEVIKANFNIDKNHSVSGVLDYKVSSKKFSLWSPDFFDIENHSNIYGKTIKNQHISLLNCLGNKSVYYGHDESSYTSEVYSHTMIIGKDKVVPENDKFISISLTVGNPFKIFGNLKSFGYIHFPDSKLIEALNKQEHTPQFDNEKIPNIAYFNGDFDIFAQTTKLGMIKAHNSICFGSLGSAEGVKIENKVIITIDFDDEVSMEEAFKRAHLISLFLRFIGGNGLFFKDISLKKVEDERSEFFVYRDNFNWGEDEAENYYSDPLVDVTNKGFLELLKSWFDKEERESVRYSFYNTYFKKVYSPDRLITAANMFDIFPVGDEDKKKPIPHDAELLLKKLKGHIKSELCEFKNIREAILQSIGYISRKSLKERVLERVEIIKPHLISNKVCVEDLKLIIVLAIKCRNYYVHGSEYKTLIPGPLLEFQTLFINTFEYIYALSDLIECGWIANDVSHRDVHHKIKHYEKQLNFDTQKLRSIGVVAN